MQGKIIIAFWLILLLEMMPTTFVKSKVLAPPTICEGNTNKTKINSTIAEKDTYVTNESPTDNLGGLNKLYVGMDTKNCLWESYIYFNFFGKPNNFSSAEISLDFHGISKTAYLNVCLIEENWYENYMNWNNKPNKGEYISHLTVAHSGIQIINVTSYIESRNNISICLYGGDTDKSLYIDSREYKGLFLPASNPNLIWYYNETKINSTIAEKDTYVTTEFPTDNFGGLKKLYVRMNTENHLQETYIYFNLTNKPKNIKTANISLNFHGVSKTAYLNVCLIDENWYENYMNWNNKPNKGEYISQLTVAHSGINIINVTSYIESRNNISICLYGGSNESFESLYIDSRESESLFPPASHPKLIWSYNETILRDNKTNEDPKSYDILFFGVISVIGVSFIFIVIISRSKNLNKQQNTFREVED